MGERKSRFRNPESGAVGLTIYCETREGGRLCGHSGSLTIAQALARWGPSRRLDALPLVCSACGGRQIEARPISARWRATGCRRDEAMGKPIAPVTRDKRSIPVARAIECGRPSLALFGRSPFDDHCP